MDIKEQMIANMLKTEFKRGVEVGMRKAAHMFRLTPKDQWDRIVHFLENEDLNNGTWQKVEAIIESDKIFDAEIVE